MTKKELYDQFIKISNYYTILIDHNQIIKQLSEKYLLNFPKKLPLELKEALEKDKPIAQQMLREIEELSKLKPEEAYRKIPTMSVSAATELQESISFSIFHLMKREEEMRMRFQGETSDYFDLEFSINGQAILVLNSILEGFLKQTINILLELNPSITFKKIQTNIKWRLKTLRNRFDLRFTENPHFEKILKNMGLIRHVFTHNSGLVDQEFIDKTGYIDFKVNDKLVIHYQMLGIAGFVTSWVVTNIFKAVIEKYFKEFDKKTVILDMRPNGIRVIKETKDE